MAQTQTYWRTVALLGSRTSTTPCCANCGRELPNPAERLHGLWQCFCSEECRSQHEATAGRTRLDRWVGARGALYGRLAGAVGLALAVALVAIVVIRSSGYPVPLGQWATVGDWTLRVDSVRQSETTVLGVAGHRFVVAIDVRYLAHGKAAHPLPLYLAGPADRVTYGGTVCPAGGRSSGPADLSPAAFAGAGTHHLDVCFGVEAPDVSSVSLWVQRNGSSRLPFSLKRSD